MASFLTGGQSNSQNVIKYSALQVGSAAYDLAIPWMRGQRRMTTNCIWYGNFQRHKVSPKGKGGGKGGGQYDYTAAVILALSSGIVTDILNVWSQGSTTTTTTLAALGFDFFTGTLTQTPWSFVETNYPDQALAYPGIAGLTNPKLDLGASAAVPDNAFEGKCCPYTDVFVSAGWTNPTTSVNTPGADVNMADFLPDLLTDVRDGMGLPSAYLPDLTQFRAYQAAQGLFFSPYLVNQEKATDVVDRWATLSNCWIYDSGTSLQIVPLGDTAITANGYTYTPDLNEVFNLGPADFVSNPPVSVDIKDQADCYNRTIVSITDRTMGYVTNPIEYKSQSLIRQYGRSDADNLQADEVCCPAVGNIIAQLRGRRNANITHTYKAQTSYRWIRLLPGAIGRLTDPTQNLLNERVRITGVAEDENGVLSFDFEEFPDNIGTYYARTPQPGPAPQTPNLLADPGSVNTPAIVEPSTLGAAGSSTVIIAASGGPMWGGAQVWLSFDGTSYSQIGAITNPAIQGVLTASLATYGGTNPDTGHTLSVDCGESQGEPEPVTNADAAALRTLCLVAAQPTTSGSDKIIPSNGELLAFGDVTATGTYTADLTYLYRGAHGTAAGAHSIGDQFTLFDISGNSGSTIEYELPAQYVGATIWLKFASFNVFEKSTQDLSVCQSYKYTPTGAGFGGGSGGVPKAPPAPTATAGSQQVSLAWPANAATDNVTAYNVYRAAGTGGSFGSAVLIASPAGLSFVDTGLGVSTGYTYFLKAVNALGASAASSGTSVTTLATSAGGFTLDTDGTLAANSDSRVATQKATKAYVDAVAQGLSIRDSCLLATAAALPSNIYANGSSGVGATIAVVATGTLTVDGIVTALGNRILVKNEATAANNGIYIVTTAGAIGVAAVLTRATDFNSATSILPGSFTFIEEGTANTAAGFVLTTVGTITVGTTSLSFTQLSGPGGATTLTGDVTGSGSGSIATTLAASGVAAATYGDASNVAQITVDAKGRVTSVTNISITGGGSSSGGVDAQFFGDGSDGNVTISSGTTTLTRDMYYNNLTISGTGQLAPNRYRVFVAGTLDLSAAPAGAIAFVAQAGNNASGSTGGTGGGGQTAHTFGNVSNNGVLGAAGFTGVGQIGIAGNTGGTAGTVGGDSGASGAGGTSSVNAGGASRAGAAASKIADVRTLRDNLVAFLSAALAFPGGGAGGPGGSSGGGDGTGTGGGGGGGGAGGAELFLAARTINRGASTAAGAIAVKGGKGGNGAIGSGGTNRGGGGGGPGGGGGWLYLIYRVLTGSTATGCLDVTGGDGGAGGNGTGAGSGGDGGAPGGGGRIDVYDLGAGTQTITPPTAGGTGNAHSSGTGGTTKAATAQQISL